MSEVNPIPPDRPWVVPYLTVNGAAKAIEFYTKAFGAVETARMATPDGRLLHAEMTVGEAGLFYLSDDFPEMRGGQESSPTALGGSTVSMSYYVPDCDATFKQAVEAGATPMQEPEDQFWGDRFAVVADPFGHYWSFSTHVRDLTPEEVMAAAEAAMAEFS